MSPTPGLGGPALISYRSFGSRKYAVRLGVETTRHAALTSQGIRAALNDGLDHRVVHWPSGPVSFAWTAVYPRRTVWLNLCLVSGICRASRIELI